MSSTTTDDSRRRFLTLATSAVAAAGVVGVAVPFAGSWNPSAKAKAAGAPVRADVSRLEPGAMVVIEWRGKPVYVVRRTQAMLDDLPNVDPLLKDPDSAISKQPAYITDNRRSIPAGTAGHRRSVHAPRLRPEIPPGSGCGGPRWRPLARRLLLSLPRLQVRPRRARLLRRARLHQPGGPAPLLRGGEGAGHRYRCAAQLTPTVVLRR
jgi:ubiquinol-cytochrome c reductase iron-sulfur subunit